MQFFDPRSTTAVLGKPNAWFDPSHFRRVAAGAARFGNFGRNVFHGPGINNWDFAAFKQVAMKEDRHLEFRAELLNLFNHTQFLNPVSNVADSDFGRVRDTRGPRIAQLSLRFLF